jgi:O-antigen ligase
MRIAEKAKISQRAFWLWVALFVIQMQPFEILISGYDPSFPSTAYSARPIGTYFRLLCTLYPCWLIFKNWHLAQGFFAKSWPFLLFIAYASLISVFVASPAETNRYIVMTIFPVAITPFAAAALLRPIDFLRAWASALAILCIMSLALVAIDPSVAIVGKTELAGIGSPGNWRGAFATKNVLGHVAGIALGVLLTLQLNAMKNLPLFLVGLIASATCLFFSASSTGYILAIAMPAAYYSLVKPEGGYRFLSLIGTLIGIALFIYFREDIVKLALGLTGKKADLTGRAAIWDMAKTMIPDAGLFGKGINYTTTLEFMQRLKSMFGVGYIHNEFLDVSVNMGIVGSILFYFMFGFAAYQAWTVRIGESDLIARNGFTVLLLGWIVSGISETTNFNMLALLYVPLFGLLSIRPQDATRQSRGVKQKPF